ncbi:hypothetical protein KQH40_01535 [bacterium]|nr:hypothetical protein [bacterium]
MNKQNRLPTKLTTALISDAVARDRVTARRAALLEILWYERYLTRKQLISRVEYQEGMHCFGIKTWQETFFRDMRFVKKAFSTAGYTLKYSRSTETPGYYLKGEGNLHKDIQIAIRGAIAELDEVQMLIYQRLTPAQKFAQAVSMIDLGRKVSSNISTQRQEAENAI